MTEWIISSSALILVIILLRRVLQGKISLRLQYALWALVLVRLLLPFSFFESSMSLMNLVDNRHSTEYDAAADRTQHFEEIEYITSVPQISATSTDIEEIYTPPFGTIQGYYPGDSDHMFPAEIMESATVEEFQQLEKTMKARELLIPIWLAGTAVIALYFLITNLHFGNSLRRSRREMDVPGGKVPVYISELIPTPCLFGLFRPAVYLTPDCENDLGTMRHVLAHEFTHYRHGDNVWAILRCAVLAMHWYNPLVWWAAVLSKRDAELACDEGAIRRLGENERAPYGRTLIGMTCQRRDITALAHTATTMTGSGKSIKERISLIAKKPKMAVYTLVAVLIIAAIAALCTFSGANRGFTDKEALKEALPLAESCAFTNSLELDGDGVVTRSEGYVLEAGDGLRQQYVSVEYALKNSPFHIIVDFAMLDEKGERYSEPFSASTYISKTGTPIIEDISTVRSIGLWKNGYENPVLPPEYEDELLNYLAEFHYGEHIRHNSELTSLSGGEGFTVYFKGGSSMSFALDIAEGFHIVRPELPDWLGEIFYSREIELEEYREKGVAISEELLKFDRYIINYATDIVQQDMEYISSQFSCNIEEAEILSISQIQTGTAGQNEAVNMYELEYRLHPDKPENIRLGEGMVLTDGWLINGSFGKKYFILYHTSINYTVPIATLTDFDMEAYRASEYIERYGSEYTAACVELKSGYMDKLREDVVYANDVGDLFPLQLHDAIRHIVKLEAKHYTSILSGVAAMEVSGVRIKEAWPGRSMPHGNMMIEVDFRLQSANPEEVVLVGGMQYAEDWLSLRRYLVCDMYDSEPGMNYRVFDELFIQETYSFDHYIEAYGNMYAAACAEAFNIFPQAIVWLSTHNERCEPFQKLKHSQTWDYTYKTWLMGDGNPLTEEYMASIEHLIPHINYSPEFSLQVRNGKAGTGKLYTSELKPLELEAGDTVRPGEYYLLIPVSEVKGQWINIIDAFEEASYDCIVHLSISEPVEAEYVLNPQSSNPFEGSLTLRLSEDKILGKLTNALDTQDEQAFLEILPHCPINLIPPERLGTDFFDMVTESAFGENQLMRDYYILKGYFMSDGALSQHYADTIFAMYLDHEETFCKAMSYLRENEFRLIDQLLRYGLDNHV